MIYLYLSKLIKFIPYFKDNIYINYQNKPNKNLLYNLLFI